MRVNAVNRLYPAVRGAAVDSASATVAPAPSNANERRRRRHWGWLKKEKDRVAREVFHTLKPRRPVRTPVLVVLERQGWNPMDPAGVIESSKAVVDALVALGVIPDDSSRYVTGFRVEQKTVRHRVAGAAWSCLTVRLEAERIVDG